MKKRILIVFGILLLLSMNGCAGERKEAQGEQSRPKETAEEAKEEPEGEGLSEEPEEEEPAEQPEQESVFEITVRDDASLQWETALNGSSLHFTGQTVEAHLTEYPEAEEAIERFFPARAKSLYTEMETIFREYYSDESWAETWQEGEHLSNMNIEAKRTDSQVLSFYFGGSYYGGEGSMYNGTYYEGAVFDTVSGERLRLRDVVRNTEAFLRFAKAYVVLSTYHDDSLMENYALADNVPTITLDIENNNWYFDEDGLAVICNPLEKDILTVIEQVYVIPYGLLLDYLKPEYIPDGTERQEPLQAEPVDFMELFRDTSDLFEVADASGLDVAEQWGDTAFYTAFDGAVSITTLASAPKVHGVSLERYVEGISVGGCTIGMSASECIAKYQEMGFDERIDCGYDGRINLFKEEELAVVTLYVIEDIVVEMDYGIFQGENEWFPDMY